jgi:hypothetical protein
VARRVCYREQRREWRGSLASCGTIRMPLLRKMIGLRGVDTPLGLVLGAAYSLHHDGILRSGEGTGGVLASEVTEESFVDHLGKPRNNLDLMVDRTKTHRTGDPVKVPIADYDDEWSAFKLIAKLKRATGVGVRTDKYLFPQVRFTRGVPTGIDLSATLTYEAFVKCVKYDVEQCGENPEYYAGHSFRAGGATDLFASGELSFAQIMKIGRWRTLEACLVYYREDLEVSGRAGQVFGKQAGEVSNSYVRAGS